MIPVKVIGIGSPFGDDRLGWEVIDQLRQYPLLKKLDSTLWQASTCDRPGLQLLSAIQGAATVFLVDAIYSVQRTSGYVWHATAEDIAQQSTDTGDSFSSHGLGVFQAVELGRVLGLLPPRLEIYGIVTHSLDKFSTQLSAEVKQAVPSLVTLLAEAIHNRPLA